MISESDLRKSSGRQRQQLQPYNLFVLENELESFEKNTNERDMAILRAEEWRQNAQQHKDEVNRLLEEMATDILTFSEEIEFQSARIEELTDHQNKGKILCKRLLTGEKTVMFKVLILQSALTQSTLAWH